MATINSVINNCPANISPTRICAWLSELDKKISQEIVRKNDFVPYNFPEDAEKELIVKIPHDNIYNLYIYAMIDFFVENWQCIRHLQHFLCMNMKNIKKDIVNYGGS